MEGEFLPIRHLCKTVGSQTPEQQQEPQTVHELAQDLRKQKEEDIQKKALLKEIPMPREADTQLPASEQRLSDCSTCSCQKHNEQLLQDQTELDKSVPVQRRLLSNLEARQWYLSQEARIPSLLNTGLPLEQQARQAFELRNTFRTEARRLMEDRDLAESLDRTDPNLTWDEVVEKYTEKKYSGDKLYTAIIKSSQRSRKSVNEGLGIKLGGADEHTGGETHQ